MDRKAIIVVAICFLLLLFLQPLANRLFPPKSLPPGATNQVVTATAPTGTPTNAAATTTPPAPTTAPAPVSTAKPVFHPTGEETTLVIANDNARYTFTSHGGGLKLVELLHYPETVSRKHKKEPFTNDLAELNAHVSVPVLAILGGESVQGDDIFTLTQTGTGVRAEKTLANGLRWIKEFQPTTNYLVTATVRLENTSGQPLNLPEQQWTIGTATPMGPDDKNAIQNVGLMWYDGSAKPQIGQTWFDNRTLGCFPGVPRPEYRAGESNVVWAAVFNQFFALVAMPALPAQQVVATPVDLPREAGASTGNGNSGPPPKGIQGGFAYPGVTLAPGQVLERQFNIFAGPKEYRTLARIANRFQNEVDAVMGFDTMFPFYKLGGFFGKALLLGMNALHNMFHLSYGWAIIAITVIIKLLFWPLTQASTRSMKRLQALQPQMAAIREKYKEDPVKMNKKTMEFMRENKVSPLGGCWPMMLQMPVFFGFFTMIRTAIELRGASWLWVADLSKPDTLFTIPGTGIPFNLLPLLMGGTMLWQSHLTPPSPGMDPMQQKMMRYMPLMFLVFLYNYSSGLALYWTMNNLLSILQTKLTKNITAAAPPPVSPLTPASKKKK